MNGQETGGKQYQNRVIIADNLDEELKDVLIDAAPTTSPKKRSPYVVLSTSQRGYVRIRVV